MKLDICKVPLALAILAMAPGCPGQQAQCQKACQHLYLDCAAGPASLTVSQCESNCTGSGNLIPTGATCVSATEFYSCLTKASCGQLLATEGDAVAGCAIQAGCDSPLVGGSGGGGGGASSGSSSGGSGGSTSGGASSDGGCGAVGSGCGANSGCCSNYCSAGACHCNEGSSAAPFYPCASNGDCCSPATCVANHCVVPAGGSSSGGSSDAGASGGSSSGGSSSGGRPPTVGAPCALGGNPDSCAADNAGLACNPNRADGGGACTLPWELEACLTGVGCATSGQQCLTVPGGEQLCLTTGCTSSPPFPTCPQSNLETSCQTVGSQSACFWNFCGPGIVPANGTTYYAPCDSGLGAGNGTCLPFAENGTTFGLCIGNGPYNSAPGGVAGTIGCGLSLQLESGASGIPALCESGTLCVSDASAQSFCAPLCTVSGPTAAGGGPTCASGYDCLSFGEPYGVCAQACTGNASCASPFTCQGGHCEP